MELLKDILSILIYTIITGCGVVIVKKVLDFINTKVDELQTSTRLSEYNYVNAIIDQVQKTVTTIVTTVNQVLVDSLKASGSFTKESAIEAKDMALDMAKKLLTDEAIKAIETVYGDAEVYVDSLIEQIVNELKKN